MFSRIVILCVVLLSVAGPAAVLADGDGLLHCYFEIRTSTWNNGRVPPFQGFIYDITDPQNPVLVWTWYDYTICGYTYYFSGNGIHDVEIYAHQTTVSVPPSPYAEETNHTIIENIVDQGYYMVWLEFGPAGRGRSVPSLNSVTPESLGRVKALFN